MTQLMAKTLAPSTTRTYNGAFQAYLEFCQQHNLKALPVHETNLMLFVTYISTTSISNIKTHISATKHFAAYLIGQHTSNYPRLYMLVRAIKRRAKKGPKRTPVTLPGLRIIYSFIASSSWPQADKIMLWAAVTTAFFGFLRSSEYVSPQTQKYDPESTLCFSIT